MEKFIYNNIKYNFNLKFKLKFNIYFSKSIFIIFWLLKDEYLIKQ